MKIIDRIAENRAQVQTEQKRIEEAQARIEELEDKAVALKVSATEFRASLKGSGKVKEYRRLRTDLEAAEKKLKDWLATGPQRTPGSTKKYKSMTSKIGQLKDKRGNSENPELYSVFPYRLHGVGQPSLDVAINTWSGRAVKRAGCWHQDLVHSAQLGLAKEAKVSVIRMAGARDRPSRFAAFWSVGHDWNPDQCHGGNLMVGIHRMVLQWDDAEKIYVLPAWPKEWDVDFRLHASGRTVVNASFAAGKLLTRIEPDSRAKDVVIPDQIGWAGAER